MNLQPTLFDGDRMTLADAIDLTAQSLNAYAQDYEHWAIAFSGGKDSAATLAVVCWLIKTGRVKAPKSLTVLQSDTRLELPPLWATAQQIMVEVRERGFEARVVLPTMDDRYFVYMLGRGVPPPSNTFRWCTAQLKIEPMMAALKELRDRYSKKFLMLTGVRVGESAARDARIAVSCGKNNSECGQGWFQEATPEAVADTLAPLLHWRLCHVWDWLTGMVPEGYEHGFSTRLIAAVYGQNENLETHARTGCAGCNLAARDFALESIVRRPQWAHFAPLLELRPLYAELKKPENRLRKPGREVGADGTVRFTDRMGPLTFAARLWALERVLDIQSRAGVDLINPEEEARIRTLIAAGTWPNRWTGNEPLASLPFERVNPDGSVQPEMMALLQTISHPGEPGAAGSRARQTAALLAIAATSTTPGAAEETC